MNLFLQVALILTLVQVPQSQTHFPVVHAASQAPISRLREVHVIYLWPAICYLCLLNIILDSGPRSNSVGPGDSDHCFLFDSVTILAPSP